MKRIRINLSSLLDGLIALFIILDTHSIYSASATVDYNILLLLMVFLVARVLLVLPMYVKRINRNSILAMAVWLFYILIFTGISASRHVTFIGRFIILPILLATYFDYLLVSNQLKRVLRIYIGIIKWIMYISIFFWIFGSLLNILGPTGELPIQWGRLVVSQSYFGVYFQWQNDAFFLGRQFFRNIGIFTEAPMFSLNISMAYLIEFFIFKEKSIKSLLVYVFTILSTYSIAGILLLILTQFLALIFRSFSNLFERGRVDFILLLLPIVVISTAFLSYELLVSKLSSQSGGSRTEDYIIGYQAWRYNPWFGSGIGNMELLNSLKSLTRSSRSATGYTNSVMIVLVQGGIYFFASYLFALLHYVFKALTTKDSDLLIFGVMLIYLFVTTTFQFTALMIAIISFTLVSSVKLKHIISD